MKFIAARLYEQFASPVATDYHGCTLVLASSGTVTVAPSLYSTMPYDPVQDLSPILLLSHVPIVLVVNPILPAKSVNDFIVPAKSKAGKMTMSSAGNGTTRLNATGNKTLAMPTTREGFASVGADILDGMPAQLDANLKQELAKWKRVAKAATSSWIIHVMKN